MVPADLVVDRHMVKPMDRHMDRRTVCLMYHLMDKVISRIIECDSHQLVYRLVYHLIPCIIKVYQILVDRMIPPSNR